MRNKYLIKVSRKFWFWFWTKLMNGFAPSDLEGNYTRPKGITSERNYNINNQNGQIYLLVGNSCPWCHRTLIVYKIKNLFKKVKVIFLKADIEHGEWIFDEKFKGFKTLSDFYQKIHKNNIYRATLPLLISSRNDSITILSNESAQIIELLNAIRNESVPYPQQIQTCNQYLLDLIHHKINDGVYKCGFARNQSSYETASTSLFLALKEIEEKLAGTKGDWICGENLTYADIYLFPTLIRWEIVYSKLFKCTAKEISDFKEIIQWRLKFFNFSNVHETCFDTEWKKDYYQALFPLNPNQIIPVLPSLKEIIRLEAY